MGHIDRPEEEDKGYEGCSESDGGSDVDRPNYPQVQLLYIAYLLLLQLSFLLFIIYFVRLENTERKAVQVKLMAERSKDLASFLLQQT